MPLCSFVGFLKEFFSQLKPFPPLEPGPSSAGWAEGAEYTLTSVLEFLEVL